MKSGLKYRYVTVEGNIGAGKTTLVNRLSAYFNARPVLERFEENPYLPRFYKRPGSYAFPLEISFLTDRYRQIYDNLVDRKLSDSPAISDYFIDKSLIFAKNNLDDEEFDLYSGLFQILSPLLPKPELIIYLDMDISQLMENIRKRGRDYEMRIRPEYLEKIHAGYMNYFYSLNGVKTLIVDINNADIGNDWHFKSLLDIIRQSHDPGIHRFYVK